MSQITPTADGRVDAPLFSIPDYRRGWLLGLLSGIVRWLEFLALGIFAYQLTESPSLVAGNSNPLPVGAVFTVEPGIYIPGVGGARIEDDIVLTETGYISFTSMPRDLITIG